MMVLFPKNNLSNKFIKTISIFLIVFYGCENDNILGCIYSDACNYNPIATEDDGSCEYESCTVCLDPEACNYNLILLMSLDPETIIEDPSLCIYPEENYDCFGNFIDFRLQYIGEWEFVRTSGYSNPYGTGTNETTFIGVISLGNSPNTLLIPQGTNENILPVEFEVDEVGQLNDFNNIYYYAFDGYFTGDSLLYWTGINGSPFQTSSLTCYGQKIQ